jgi:hypothetical protein
VFSLPTETRPETGGGKRYKASQFYIIVKSEATQGQKKELFISIIVSVTFLRGNRAIKSHRTTRKTEARHRIGSIFPIAFVLVHEAKENEEFSFLRFSLVKAFCLDTFLTGRNVGKRQLFCDS